MAKNYGKNKTALINLFNDFIKSETDDAGIISLSITDMVERFNEGNKAELKALNIDPISENFVNRNWKEYLYIKRIRGEYKKWKYTTEKKKSTSYTIDENLKNVKINDIQKMDVFIVPHQEFPDGEYHADDVFNSIRDKLGISPQSVSYYDLGGGKMLLFISSGKYDHIKDKLKG